MGKSRKELNNISKVILESAIDVHRELGAGLLESVYETCLYTELSGRKLNVKTQVPVKINYKEKVLEADFRIDLLVENEIVIELKAVDNLLPVHEAQLLTYMKLNNSRLGFLINFNVVKLVDGFKRKVMNF